MLFFGHSKMFSSIFIQHKWFYLLLIICLHTFKLIYIWFIREWFVGNFICKEGTTDLFVLQLLRQLNVFNYCNLTLIILFNICWGVSPIRQVYSCYRPTWCLGQSQQQINAVDIWHCLPTDRTWHKLNDPKVDYSGNLGEEKVEHEPKLEPCLTMLVISPLSAMWTWWAYLDIDPNMGPGTSGWLWFGWVSLFYGISTFVDYLMPKPFN